MRQKECERCGTTFSPSRPDGRFCARSCATRAHHAQRVSVGEANPNWKGGGATLACDECGKPFTVKHVRVGKARYCSLECFNQLQKREPKGRGPRVPRVSRPCRQCGTVLQLTEKARDAFCSQECHRRWRAVRLTSGGNVYSSARRGRRADLGETFFRSAWEANYARYLNLLKQRGQVLEWEYEPTTFWFDGIRRGVCSYTPDFRVRTADGEHYVEIKGWMDAKSRTKLKRMKKYHPGVEVRLVGQKEYRALARLLGGAIPNWEEYR